MKVTREEREQDFMVELCTVHRTLIAYGISNFLVVMLLLDAQRSLTMAESVLAAFDSQVATDQVRLFLASGGVGRGRGNP